MRRCLVPLLFALIASLTTVSPLLAGERAGAFSVSPYFGGYTFDGAQQLETRPVYGIRVGYDITDNLGVEGVFNYVSTDMSQNPYGASDVGVKQYSPRLDLLYNFRPDKTLVPYLAIGGGALYQEGTTYTRHFWAPTANIGGGLKYFVTDSIALRADARQIVMFEGYQSATVTPVAGIPNTYSSRQNREDFMFNWEYSVGLSFLFPPPKQAVAAVAPPPPPPAPAPMPEPVPAPAPKPEPLPEKVCITLNIEFDYDRADIKPKYHGVIGKVADFMKKYPKTTTEIQGHTDNRGTYKYNIKLSERRAASVRTYLIDKFGIEPDRLTTKGFGYTKPKDTNKTAKGRQRNRRIEAMIDCIVYVDKSQ